MGKSSDCEITPGFTHSLLLILYNKHSIVLAWIKNTFTLRHKQWTVVLWSFGSKRSRFREGYISFLIFLFILLFLFYSFFNSPWPTVFFNRIPFCTLLCQFALKNAFLDVFLSYIFFACVQANLLFPHCLSHFSLLQSHNPLNTYTSNLPVLFCNCTLLLTQVLMNKLKGKRWRKKNQKIMRVGVNDGLNSWLHSWVWLWCYVICVYDWCPSSSFFRPLIELLLGYYGIYHERAINYIQA